MSYIIALYDMRKPNVLLDKLIIIGLTILEIAKLEMNINYNRLQGIFGNNMQLLYTDTDNLKLLIKITNPYELDDIKINTVFPLEPDKNEKCFGYLICENGECSCIEYNAKAPKTYEEKRINQLRSVKAKRLKTGIKKIY